MLSDDEFLTANGTSRYLDVMAAAAERVAAHHRTTTSIGMVDGHAELHERLARLADVPARGVGIDGFLDELATHVLPHCTAVSDPRYVAHLHCPPGITSLGAEAVLSALNQSMDSFDQAPAATVVEQHVVDWLCRAMGYARGDGVFTSGGTQSNLQALLMARDNLNRRLGWDGATRGLHPDTPTWRIVCTAETHFTVATAARLLGLGTDAIVHARTDDHGRLDPASLTGVVDACHERGETVMAVVATAGTTSMGAIDPLAAIVDVAARHGIWTHVDAAAGGCLMLTPTHRHLLDGIAGADSITLDFHKLLFQTISCSALLVKDPATLDVVCHHADYLNPDDEDDADAVNLVEKSLQTTRRFDALKVLATLRSLGTDGVAELIDRTVDSARAAETAVADQARLVLLVPRATNTVVVRWQTNEFDAETLDAINATIRRELARQQRAVLGRTRIGGRVALKLTFVNPVCTPDVARALIADIAATGDRVAANPLPAPARA